MTARAAGASGCPGSATDTQCEGPPVKFLVLQTSEEVDAVGGSLGQLGQIQRHAAAAEVEIVGRSATAPASP